MTAFDEMFASTASPLLFLQFGELIEYKPAAGPNVPLTAIVEKERVMEVQHGNEKKQQRAREVVIYSDPESEFGGIANPLLTARITIHSEEWSVASRTGPSGGLWTITVVKSSAVEMARKDYRADRAVIPGHRNAA